MKKKPKRVKARNPYVVPSRKRKAGPHRTKKKAEPIILDELDEYIDACLARGPRPMGCG